MKYSKIRSKLTRWFQYYFVFSKAALLISALVFGHSLVEHAVVDVLMSYIRDTWEDVHLHVAAAAVSTYEVTSTIVVVLLAHASDAYFGHFKMILITTKTYIIGLVLLCITGTKIWLLVVALVLISVGTAGKEPPLKEFLVDQLRRHEQSLDGNNEFRVQARTEVWWLYWWCLGSITATFAFPDVDWPNTFKIVMVVMFVAYWLFRFGESLPYCQSPTSEENQTGKQEASASPLSLAYRVLKAAIMKRHLHYPDASNFFKNDSGELILLPNIPFFRWLDKAAIVDPFSLSPEEQEKQGKLCSVAQVKEIKYLLKMVPMWATFLVYGLVEATGSTFFVEQTSNLSSPITNSFVNIVIAFNAVKSLTSFIVPYLYELLIQRRWSDGRQKQGGLLVRIGVGMVSSIICCCAAWQVEARRLNMVDRDGVKDDPDVTIHMSILWLVPQFCLLGFMEGLAEDGLVDFFCDLVADSMKSYARPFTNCILSIGKLVNIACVFVFRDWFRDNVNDSHLDRYYLMLTLLSSGNLCFYCYVSYWYMHGEGEAVRVHPSTTSDDGHQDSVTASHPSNGSQSTTQSSLHQATTSLSRRRSKTFEIYGGI
ncbi:protein NRT1/ PTR FAMILY 5.7-like isoform X3 [Vitis riparia]|uniref:protein NRT1/ PTR FAMILY 5.7-like isoform X3 n=1 Tax=Vitis riparia TaxID=96939 RepID=UPI00155AE5CB|nr:protein NRT1/ PTR FAMILY 5.7-like isoform X3 [Vitis riparia]